MALASPGAQAFIDLLLKSALITCTQAHLMQFLHKMNLTSPGVARYYFKS